MPDPVHTHSGHLFEGASGQCVRSKSHLEEWCNTYRARNTQRHQLEEDLCAHEMLSTYVRCEIKTGFCICLTFMRAHTIDLASVRVETYLA